MSRMIWQVVTLVIVCSLSLAATTIRVPAQQPTIKAGVNAAVNNDTVLVASGVYNDSSVAFNGKKIVVRSEKGRDSTTVHAQFIFRQMDNVGAVLDGFTVGYSMPIVCFGGANPTVKNCTFRDGYSDGSGGGANVVIASPVFTNCLFTNNFAKDHGGAIFAMGAESAPPCNLQLNNCDFIENSGGDLGGTDIYTGGGARVTISNSFFQGDHVSYGGAISGYVAHIEITSCTFVDYDFYNLEIESDFDGGRYSYLKVDRSIIAHGPGLAMSASTLQDSLLISRSILAGFGPIIPESTMTLTGYILTDPLFCDSANGDYRISSTSSAAPAHNAWGVQIGKYGVGCTLPYICGNADGDAVVSISDAVFLIDYIFGGGMQPAPQAAADADCSGLIDLSDAVYLINYIFGGGSAPCASCP